MRSFRWLYRIQIFAGSVTGSRCRWRAKAAHDRIQHARGVKRTLAATRTAALTVELVDDRLNERLLNVRRVADRHFAAFSPMASPAHVAPNAGTTYPAYPRSDEPTPHNVTGGNRREDQSHQHLRRRSGESAALLHRRPGLREEGGLHAGAVPVAHRRLSRGAGWH